MACGKKIGTHTCHLSDQREPHVCYCGLVWPWPEVQSQALEFWIMAMITGLGIVLFVLLFLL